MSVVVRRLVTVVALVLVLTSALGRGHGQAQSADTLTVTQAFKQALGRGDFAATAALFADDAIVVNFFGVHQGTAGILAFVDQLTATNTNLSVTFDDSAIVLDTAVHHVYLSSDQIRAAGAPRIVEFETLV